MTTDVGHGLRRRGRMGDDKRRTPRAAIAAGALAAASIPLWPAPANATTYDEYKSETHTWVSPFSVSGVQCPVVVTSYRVGERVGATTAINSSDTSCRELILRIEVGYVPLGSGSVKSITVYGTASSELRVTADGARDLTQSTHTVGVPAYWGLCACTDYTLNHPK